MNLHEQIAKAAFEAYNEKVLPGQTPWKTFNGQDVPRWEGLNDSVRAKWMAAVEGAFRAEAKLDPNRFIARRAVHGEVAGG